MKSCFKNIFLVFLGLSFFFIGCKKTEIRNRLSVNSDKILFSKDGNSTNITIQTDADSWNILNPASGWLTLSSTSGTLKTATIKMTVSAKTIIARTDTLTISAGNATPIHIIVSQPSSDYLYSLTTDNNTLNYNRSGNSNLININTDAKQWNISSDVNWLQFNNVTGISGITPVTIIASENTGIDSRSATITITAEYAPTVHITVSQHGQYFPSYNTNPIAPNSSNMTSTAVELASKMKLGWNIGNTLEAAGGETAWGNPQVTKSLIDLVKQSGFNAIRIPCSWNQYLESAVTGKIKDTWLNRVKEVVQYCVDNDMYVVLNIHYDGGWLEKNCTVDKQESVNAKQKAFWEQIATYLRDFDEHVLFGSANEPNVSDATQMTVLTSYHQTFIDAVRSTGGRNSYRVLVIQGPSTDIQMTHNLMLSLPTDQIANKLMTEIHFYTPYQFCLMTEDASWGDMFYYWGNGNHSTTDVTRNATWGEETDVNNLFKLMKTQFVNNGIPVILGEYAAIRRNFLTGDDLILHLASRASFLKYVTQQAKANGVIPFYWDAGNMGENASALFNRSNNTVFDQQALDAIMAGANK